MLSRDALSAFSPDRTQTTVGAISHRRAIPMVTLLRLGRDRAVTADERTRTHLGPPRWRTSIGGNHPTRTRNPARRTNVRSCRGPCARTSGRQDPGDWRISAGSSASLLLIERRRRPRSVPARQAHCASQLCQLTLCGSSPTGQFVDLDDDTVMPIELHHHEALGVDLSHVRRVIRSSRTTKPTNGARRSSADQATAHSKKHPVGVACVGQRWVRKRAHRHSQEEDHQPTAEGHVTGRAQHKRARHGRSSQEPASKCPLMPRSAVPV